MLEDKVLDNILTGADNTLPDEIKQRIQANIKNISKDLEDAQLNRSAKQLIGSGSRTNVSNTIADTSLSDTQLYTNISDMINNDNRISDGFGTMLDSLAQKNKKYFSIIKDYELMPILIPQINRVLMFLVNECISPDIQNNEAFQITYTGKTEERTIQEDIDKIKHDMKLDNLLRNVYTNRYKLGREYYIVIDYNKTFNHMIDMIHRKSMNETTCNMPDIQYLDTQYERLSSTINEVTANVGIMVVDESTKSQRPGSKFDDKDEPILKEATAKIELNNLNIIIDRSPIAKYVKEAHGELLAEAYSNYSMSNILSGDSLSLINEAAVTDTSKLEQLVIKLRDKKLRRCTIERLDPANVFKLKIGGKVIGYFHVTDINDCNNVVNFAQSLKDQLLKSRATNTVSAANNAEKVISKELSTRIINAFDPNIGISRIEDIDLLHDFILNNEIYRGNKRITFHYADEIYDLSRADESILTNGVFFTKLYATLLLNNIMTKVLRGRGRQIHTVKLGASPNVQRYIQNAMASLTMPENNLGTMHGSFEQLMNPFNASSDIVIPTEENDERYITTDYIPGQDVNMDDDFLKSLLNAIVSSFGLDSAVIDATNGNIQFAKTLSMESLQISNSIRNEQQDLHDEWESMCLKVLELMGNEDTVAAINNNQVVVKFFEPKSLVLQNTIDEINNAKSYAEAIADIIPELNAENSEVKRNNFVYNIIKSRTNINWTGIIDHINNAEIQTVDDKLSAKIAAVIQEYNDNTEERVINDGNGNGVNDSDEGLEDDDLGDDM